LAAYFIARVRVTDAEKWKAYVAAVPATIQQYGGRTLARGFSTGLLEGDDDGRQTVIIEWPDAETIRKWWESAEYQAALKLRDGAAELDAWIVQGANPAQ
jgi:uncharacterized protein (DUF1330 family)